MCIVYIHDVHIHHVSVTGVFTPAKEAIYVEVHGPTLNPFHKVSSTHLPLHKRLYGVIAYGCSQTVALQTDNLFLQLMT